jgi:phosphoglycerate dehydrogenase-like enzyme
MLRLARNLLVWMLTAAAGRLQVTRQVFEASKGRLKVVGRAGVGVDNVDLAAATEVCHQTMAGTVGAGCRHMMLMATHVG